MQELRVERWTNLHDREAGDAPSAQLVKSHAQRGILGFLCLRYSTCTDRRLYFLRAPDLRRRFHEDQSAPLQAGLVVVADTAELGAAPNLTEEALACLIESLQRDLGRAISVAIKEIIPAVHIKPQPHGDWAQFAELGRQRGLDYLAVVVVSSTEQEYPVMLFLG